MPNKYAKCTPKDLLAVMSCPLHTDFARIPFSAHTLLSSAEVKMETQQLDKPENGFSHPPSTV